MFMDLHYWMQLLGQELSETDAIQWVAIALSVAEVLLARNNNIWLYPAGIVATLLSIFIFFGAGLYAEGVLNAYYVFMSGYGWWYWIRKKDQPPVKITRSSKKEWVIVAGIVFGGTGILYLLLQYYTDSNVPLWDAWVSATAWAGMWLLARRKIGNWILLNISNAFAVPLLFYKQLPLYAGLTIFLFVVAVQGYFKWRKLLKE